VILEERVEKRKEKRKEERTEGKPGMTKGNGAG
jgi:hypothetical protein